MYLRRMHGPGVDLNQRIILVNHFDLVSVVLEHIKKKSFEPHTGAEKALKIIEVDDADVALALPFTGRPFTSILDIRSWEISIFSTWARVLRSVETRNSCRVVSVSAVKQTTTSSESGVACLGLGSHKGNCDLGRDVVGASESLWLSGLADIRGQGHGFAMAVAAGFFLCNFLIRSLSSRFSQLQQSRLFWW